MSYFSLSSSSSSSFLPRHKRHVHFHVKPPAFAWLPPAFPPSDPRPHGLIRGSFLLFVLLLLPTTTTTTASSSSSSGVAGSLSLSLLGLARQDESKRKRWVERERESQRAATHSFSFDRLTASFGSDPSGEEAARVFCAMRLARNFLEESR